MELRSTSMSEDWSTFGVDLHLDLAAGRRTALERALRTAIQSGRLAPSTTLPSTRTLAKHLGIARGTVSAAYDQLVAEGYLTSRQGSGTRVAEMPRPQTGRTDRAARSAAPTYDLRPGRPDPTTFPAAAWLRATRRVLATAPADVHALGDPRGRIELRTALAGYLGRARGVLAGPDRIVVTCGYTQAFGLLTGVLAEDGTTGIAMEDPGHPYHREIAYRAGLRVLPLPVDGDGARTHLLTGTAYADAGAVALTPAHQYPSGATLHPRRRQALTRWARETGCLVVEDDYDAEFRYDRRPVGAVQGMAPDDVAYAGSVSKTLGPALRLGWMVLPARLIDAVTEAKRYADAQTGSLQQLVLANLIDNHIYDRHVRAARLRYRRRRDELLERLRTDVPRVRVAGVAAGLHVLVRLPADGPDEATVVAAAEARDLAVQPLEHHWHRDGDHQQGLVVGYSTPPGHAWSATLDMLCAVLGQF